MRIVALGRTEILYNSILELKKNGHEIVLIITCQESPGYKITANDFKLLANSLGVEFIKAENINAPSVISQIKKQSPDIGISVNWRYIIDKKVRDCFPHGIINAHAGDLPRYRGNATPNWAIINGENKIVLTLHLMTTQLDAGQILLQKEMQISNKTYISDIYDFINKNCPKMFSKIINNYESNSIAPKEQSKKPKSILRCYPRNPKDGEIDWSKQSHELDRLIRAVSDPFAGAYTFLGIEKLIIWKAHQEIPPYNFLGTPGQVAEIKPKTGEVAVITGDGFLVLEEVETKSVGRTRASEIIKTPRTRLGLDISGEIIKLNEEFEDIKKLFQKRH